MKKFLVKTTQEVTSYQYINAETKSEAKMLAEGLKSMRSGVVDDKKEYAETKIISVEEVQLQGSVHEINEPKAPLRLKELSEKIIKNQTTKEAYVVMQESKEKIQIRDYVKHAEDYYQVYARTKSQIFLKNDLKKIVLEATGFIRKLVPIEEYIKKEKPYECIITFNAKATLVGRLNEFDHDAQEIIEKTNADFDLSDAESYWDELVEKAPKDIQEGDYYTIVRNFSKDEIRQLEKLDKYHIKVVSVLWRDLSMAARFVLEQCYDFADKPKMIEIKIGEVLKYDSFLSGKHEYLITEEVIAEIKKYAMYSRRVNILEKEDSVVLKGLLL